METNRSLYDFDAILDRRHTNSYKWDSHADQDLIPMWVADMDFSTAPCIVDALRKRVDHGIFGYTHVPQEYYDAIVNWFERRHSWTINPRHIIYTSGVVPAISAVIKALARPGDKVIVQTPAFNCFFSSIRNNGCELFANRLIYNADGSYDIDFDDLESRAADPRATLMLLCNPHNPGGRVWRREELMRIGEICLRHGVTLVSDEIHCELAFDGHEFTPYASISEELACRCVVCNSPSKAFNIAGLQIANIIAQDDEMRRRIDRAINDNEVCDVNPFGVLALIAAYNEGDGWLDALKAYIWDNYLFAKETLGVSLPALKLTPLEGTYLLWANCSAYGNADEIASRLEREAKVRLSPGTIYGPGGENFIRINLACPRRTLEEGISRIIRCLSLVE